MVYLVGHHFFGSHDFVVFFFAASKKIPPIFGGSRGQQEPPMDLAFAALRMPLRIGKYNEKATLLVTTWIVGEPQNPWIYLDSNVFSGVWNILLLEIWNKLLMIFYII